MEDLDARLLTVIGSHSAEHFHWISHLKANIYLGTGIFIMKIFFKRVHNYLPPHPELACLELAVACKISQKLFNSIDVMRT